MHVLCTVHAWSICWSPVAGMLKAGMLKAGMLKAGMLKA